jgi:phosphatidate phosphatase APP1
MSSFKRTLRKAGAEIEQSLDDLRFSLKRRLGYTDPLQIVPFRSYGTLNRLYVIGRVLEDKKLTKATENDTIFKNILNMYQRFESDEVPGAKIKITFQDQEYFATTGKEGYFVINVQSEKPIDWRDQWHEIELELIDAPVKFQPGLKATAEVLVPPLDAEYGIISDIDDTIVKTTATSLLAMSRNTFFHNAHSRLPFAGVSEFYRSLQLGRNGKRNNPFFYVSSSPWNLYDLLVDFMDLNNIPPGPLLLRDFGLSADKTGSSDHMGHKFHEIKNILTTYPQLNFVLIGDSGQEDPKIYQEVVRKFPNRILAVYIRDVQLPDREQIAIDISKDLLSHKVEMVIVDNTVEAAEHAAKAKLIFTDAIPEIIEDKKQDKGESPGKEELSVIEDPPNKRENTKPENSN